MKRLQIIEADKSSSKKEQDKVLYDAFPNRYEHFRDELDPETLAPSTNRKVSTKKKTTNMQ